MSLFQKIEGDVAVIESAGVFKQVDLYQRNGFLFASAYGGFIRLKYDGSTSKATCKLIHLETELKIHRDRLGRLGTSDIPDAIPLTPDNTKRLMLET